MKVILLSDTMAAALIQALDELEDSEQDKSCNDIFDGDKYLLLTSDEQKAARRASNEWTEGDSDSEEEFPAWNFSATTYLKKEIQRQIE